MKKILSLSWALAVLLSLMASSPASAQVASHVVISGLETGTAASASQEFIELYNPTASNIAVSGWTAEYKAASSTDIASNWVKHAGLVGTIPAYGFYLIAPKSFLASADSDWSATLAGSAGNVRLRDENGTVIDQLGYGSSANAAEGGAPAQAPPAGQSMERLPGRLSPGAGNGVDTDNNAADFILNPLPAPRTTQSLAEQPTNDADGSIVVSDPSVSVSPPPDPSPISVDDSPIAQDYAPLDITELLINPMAPLTDSHDEFIELYNPTDGPVNLGGYTVRTGSKFHSYYVLPSTTLASGAYFAFYSSQTGVSLPNSGGAAEILDPSGLVVDVTPAYGAAPEGQSWSRFDDGWHWTLQTTPGQPNVLAGVVTLNVPGTVKTAKAKKAKTSTPKAAKAKKVKKAYVPHPRKKKPKAQLAKAEPLGSAAAALHPATWLLIGLGLLTIGYALYEFRYDMHNLYQRSRRYLKVGKDDRQPDKGRPRD